MKRCKSRKEKCSSYSISITVKRKVNCKAKKHDNCCEENYQNNKCCPQPCQPIGLCCPFIPYISPVPTPNVPGGGGLGGTQQTQACTDCINRGVQAGYDATTAAFLCRGFGC